MDCLGPSESSPAWTRRRWLVALLVWLSICCMSAIVVLTELEVAGREHFSTVVGERELAEFLRHALAFPGLVLPALLLLNPRFSFFFCAPLFVAQFILLVNSLTDSGATGMSLAFWVGIAAPVGLLALASGVAYGRGNWLAPRCSA